MSMQFDKPISEDQQKFIKELMGDSLNVIDQERALFNANQFFQTDMKDIANEINQVVTLELNEPGEIKVMGDGTRYECTPKGWIKL